MLYGYRFLWPLRLGWLLVCCLYKEVIYNFLNVCPFDYTAAVGCWKVRPVNQVNHTSRVAVVAPTDRPKSVRNRCVIELFLSLFVLSHCPFDISVGVGGFVIGLSQISSFFSSYMYTCNTSCFFDDRLDNKRCEHENLHIAKKGEFQFMIQHGRHKMDTGWCFIIRQ